MMEKNLQQRLLTVFVGVPFILSIVFFIPQYNFIVLSIFVIAMAFVGSYEMSKILFGKNTLIAMLSPLLPLTQYILGLTDQNSQLTDLLFVALLLFSFMMEIKAGEKDAFKLSLERSAKNALLITYPCYFISFLLRFLALEIVTSYAVMMFFVLVFGNDIFAYVWGRLFGKNNKGILKVSPNKSVAGFVGSFVSTIALSFGFYALFKSNLPYISPLFRLLLGVVVSISANIGDLIESVFKRSAGVKDSGNIFPGRGGALDSMDSEIASAPLFFLIFKLIMEAV
ncbi:MAG: phosphatidate cytidylyltransferase [Spirochaetales bacterium]|nr:phosphatidate cytidylyltransferase [Spirochaetales bacterium]